MIWNVSIENNKRIIEFISKLFVIRQLSIILIPWYECGLSSYGRIKINTQNNQCVNYPKTRRILFWIDQNYWSLYIFSLILFNFREKNRRN